jgi:hypothetical protein
MEKHSSPLRKFVNSGQKSFITLAPGVNLIELFFFITNALETQAGVFVPGKPFRPSLIFAVRPGVLERCFTQVGSPLLTNIRLDQ